MKEEQILYKVQVSKHGDMVYYVVASNIQDAEEKVLIKEEEDRKEYLLQQKKAGMPPINESIRTEVHQITTLGKEGQALILN